MEAQTRSLVDSVALFKMAKPDPRPRPHLASVS
jgi:hypothetical protein